MVQGMLACNNSSLSKYYALGVGAIALINVCMLSVSFTFTVMSF